jgi:hypothetical protein
MLSAAAPDREQRDRSLILRSLVAVRSLLLSLFVGRDDDRKARNIQISCQRGSAI